MLNPVVKVARWYDLHGRSLPWRETRDPYRIWLSEVILQQTRIDQGLGYYHRFVERFPTVQDLADADTDTLMKYWEGLGYYSRARNLHHTSKHIASALGGVFPDNWKELLTLKGIGPYTARAIGSFAFDNPVGVLDGNVFRVLSRYMGDGSPIDLPATRVAFQERLDAWLAQSVAQEGDPSLPARFNQGVMDLGATVCTPRQALCGQCPLSGNCVASAKDMVSLLPVKVKKLQRKTVWHHFYLLGLEEGKVWIQRRPAQGLWPSLWELPNEEVSEAEWQRANLAGYELLGAFKHVFTHLDMMIKVYSGSGPAPTTVGEDYLPPRPITLPQIGEHAFSRAVLKIFERYLGSKS